MRDKAITANRLAVAAVERFRAARDTAAQQLEDATVQAPYSAVVTARFGEPGEYVKKGDRILEIIDLAMLNAELDIPERFVGAISKGMPASLEFEAGVEHAEGEVVAINPKVDRASRTFRVKIDVENALRALGSGMFCTVRLALSLETDLAEVPEAAVMLAPPGLLGRRSLEKLMRGFSDEDARTASELGGRIVRQENIIHRIIENIRGLDSLVVGGVAARSLCGRQRRSLPVTTTLPARTRSSSTRHRTSPSCRLVACHGC